MEIDTQAIRRLRDYLLSHPEPTPAEPAGAPSGMIDRLGQIRVAPPQRRA